MHQKTIQLSKLIINPSNPRFSPVQDQDQAIQTMLDREKTSIKFLAKDIAKTGLNPIKIIAVVPQDKDYVVLEGNRRIIILKLLNNSDKIQDTKLRNFFTKLKASYPIPSKVRCAIFENKDEAKHWIVLEHTGRNNGVGVVSWDTVQQARFGDKVSKLVQVVEYIGSGLDISNIEQTNLERLISTPYVRTKIGIVFSKGKIKKGNRANILKNLRLVFSAMSKKGFTVRDIDHAEDRERWIDRVLDTKHKAASDTKTTRSQPSHDPPKSSQRRHLIPSKCILSIKEARINDIFLELKNDLVLRGRNTSPNAAAVLFRVFLETSIDKYIEVIKIDVNGDPPQMKEKINKVTEHMKKAKIATESQLNAIRRISTSPDAYFLNIHWFHQYVHSRHAYPDGDSLKAKWDNLQEFFEILWAHINSKP